MTEILHNTNDAWCPDTWGGYTLYRLYTNPGNGWLLLYVGISSSWVRRLNDHRHTKPWFAEVQRIDLEEWCCAQHAGEAERQAIRGERPVYNVAHHPRYVQSEYGAGAHI